MESEKPTETELDPSTFKVLPPETPPPGSSGHIQLICAVLMVVLTAAGLFLEGCG